MAQARTVWEEGTEPGGRVVALGIAVALTAVALDLLVHAEITWLFDLLFVGLCVALALRVRTRDFFVVGVAPPLLMLGVFALIALSSPELIAHEQDGTIQALVTGLANHAGALITGYALCLGCLAMRQHVYRKRAEGAPRRPVHPTGPRVSH
ncbi:MAG: hypothetical protein L0H93_10760 [Nocardioides sp.]|nr:hypothetical protein [Nocardioides sp.]